VSAFGCDPPARLREQLAGAPARPLWVNLEYLSAEPWIDGCHGLASVKPADGAVEHFYYPGFSPASGGLLREHDAVAPAGAAGPAARDRVLARLGLPACERGERLLTLFCYPDAPLDRWLPELAAGSRATLLLAPEGVAQAALAGFAALPARPAAEPSRRGRLRLARIPFLSQDGYDALLRVADLNLVRGEDSWLRAHWARRPFVWQPYRQQGDTHLVKLGAFLDRFRAAAGEPAARGANAGVADAAQAAQAAAAMMLAWSGAGDPVAAWRRFEAAGEAVDLAFERWLGSLLGTDDLARKLASWAARRL
jgi:uncharacterized repeat protein (TIGR03837 family)